MIKNKPVVILLTIALLAFLSGNASAHGFTLGEYVTVFAIIVILFVLFLLFIFIMIKIFTKQKAKEDK